MGARGPWQWCGASVRGRGHERDGTPNQDAWSVRATADRVILAVCDGLGSKPHSDVGAKSGCRAAQAAASAWCARPGASWELLVRLLHARWALDIHPHAPADAAATCLLAVARQGSATLLAQLGDGLVLLARTDGTVEELEGGRSGFSNQTSALGAARSAHEWNVREAAALAPGDALLVATDGVSDDLLPGRKHAFAMHLLESCRAGGALDGDRLRAQLDDWPVPNHTDDRTLVLCSLRGDDE
jgi:serine/threonine protein phosphatase PrpC